ncbi:hypothetical protein LEM8419_02353 [Neolewinella maritima]|uniref:CHAT domain-containing protein n=1 Tax=Neolewinella maritima TaxID=1383882 RepID=A0ABM9B282_9BACT|nr:hypothetical protein LEM8419_02353 [Neolewinella maritima]
MLIGCTADPVDTPVDVPAPTTVVTPLTADELALRDSLDGVWDDYRALRLDRAFLRARRLPHLLTDRIAAELRAEAYQALAILHFDHMVYVDSVAHYTERARPLVRYDAPAKLRARQLLCAAYTSFDTWTWLEMQLHAQLGRRLLERAHRTTSLLYAQLSIIEARGAKQFADRATPLQRQQALWARSDTLFERAAGVLAALDSPWEGHAREHQIILLSRQPQHDPRIEQLLATLPERGRPGGPTDAPAYLGYRDHAAHYWHHRRGRRDSARASAERLLAAGPYFANKRVQGARYLLKEYSQDDGRYARAVDYMLGDLVDQGCCPPDADPTDEAALFRCNRRANCMYFISALASTYQQWGHHEANEAQLERAFRYTQAALANYERTLLHQSEEAVLNRTLVLGDRLITAALASAHERLRTSTGDARYYNALLNAMELGKTVLYTRELAAVHATLAVETVDPERVRLRQIEAEMKLLKGAFAARLTLPYDQLLRFDRLYRESLLLAERLDLTASPTEPSPQAAATAPTLAQIRGELTADQALIEYAETEHTLYALYVDRDTVLAHAQPREPVAERVDALTDILSGGMPASTVAYTASAHELYGELLGFAAGQLARRRELLVIPTASLTSLPFVALLRSADTIGGLPAYLIRSHRIRYLDSWRSEQQRHRLRERLLRRSAPTVGAWTHPDLTAYLGPLAESVLARVAGGTHYRRSACTSATLLADMDRYDWLHLSVHAAGDPTRLNENYLYLNSTDSLNGVYIGRAVLRAQLVVLAACSTARGYRNRREGTYSLRRSFHRAGVPDVVASLYDIPAAATAGILDLFYAELLAGAAPVEALTAAQRRCARGELSARWAWPGFWAGLVVG